MHFRLGLSAFSEHCLRELQHFTWNYRSKVQRQKTKKTCEHWKNPSSQTLCSLPPQQSTALTFIPIFNSLNKTKWKNRRHYNQPRDLYSAVDSRYTPPKSLRGKNENRRKGGWRGIEGTIAFCSHHYWSGPYSDFTWMYTIHMKEKNPIFQPSQF